MGSLDRQILAPLSPTLKQRNAIFDTLFYDVGALTPDEKEKLSPINDPEGAIVVVPPAASGSRIRHYAGAADFLKAEKQSIQALAIAGVGSSVLGTAALARNVADAYGFDVAGIVSGYGAADLVSEAMGGWFFYGLIDRALHEVNQAADAYFPGKGPSSLKSSRNRTTDADGNPFAKDISALEQILEAVPPKLSLVVGHSKGDLLLDFALTHFIKTIGGTDHPYFHNLRIVTFGAVTDLPKQFKNTHQFIGSIDWFGGLNSQFDIPHTRLPNAWHHLNKSLPFHLDVEAVLKEYLPA